MIEFLLINSNVDKESAGDKDDSTKEEMLESDDNPDIPEMTIDTASPHATSSLATIGEELEDVDNGRDAKSSSAADMSFSVGDT